MAVQRGSTVLFVSTELYVVLISLIAYIIIFSVDNRIPPLLGSMDQSRLIQGLRRIDSMESGELLILSSDLNLKCIVYCEEITQFEIW